MNENTDLDALERLEAYALIEQWTADASGNLVISKDRADQLSADLRFLLSIARQQEPKLLAYEHAHETAVELGFPSITEALEAVSDLQAQRDELKAENERLKAEVERLTERHGQTFDIAIGWQTRAETAEASLSRAIDALRPFAEAAWRYDENDTCDRVPDEEPTENYGVEKTVLVGDFRRAASVLSTVEKG